MHISHTIPGLLAALVFVAGAGCSKSEPSATTASAALSADSVARVHWLGKKQLGTNATAYYFMRLWGLPDSLRLETRTLEKLSLAPWRLLRGEAAMANAPGALLRPLLDDFVRAESYLEIRQATNQLPETVFAIRLDDEHAALWKSNLAAVVESLIGIHPVSSQRNLRGWAVKQDQTPNFIELTRVGDWTVLGAAQDKNALLGEIVARIKRDHAPFPARATNYWLEVDLDLQRVAGSLVHAWNLPGDLPRISVRVTGDGGNTLTQGELTFTQPLQLELEPWTIPTNLVREPLTSFTGIRGFKPWLASWKTWGDLQIGMPPNQAYFWSLEGVPMQTYCAAPLPDASNWVRKLTDVLLRAGNPWLATNSVGGFARSPDSNGTTWGGLPLLSPFVKSSDAAPGSVVFAALLPSQGLETNRPPTPEMIHDVLRRTNLVYYDWEITGPRIESWLYVGQVARIASRQAQLPMESLSMNWLRIISARLDKSATVVTRSGPNQLSFVRKSTAGFTAPELHLLADWLESPQFPRGLYSFLAPPTAPPAAGTPPTSAPAKP